MSIDYAGTKVSIAGLIKSAGFLVKLLKVDNSTDSTYALWGKSEKVTTDNGISQVYGEKKIMYMSATGRKIPEVGDTVVLDGVQWSINNVELYKPAKVTIAYKLTVEN